MIYTSLDTIVRNYLFQKGYPMHFYLQSLNYARNCLRELTFDSLHIVNTKNATVDSNSVANIPEDCVDIIKIGVPYGQFVRPLIPDNRISRLANHNSVTGDIMPYGDPVGSNVTSSSYGFVVPLLWTTNTINNFGENIGRQFGRGAGSEPDTYRILPERNEIQLNENANATQIIIEYISDGSGANAATGVPAYAEQAILDYVNWQMKEHNRTSGLGERQVAKAQYQLAHKQLRSRLNSISIDELKRIINRHNQASPK